MLASKRNLSTTFCYYTGNGGSVCASERIKRNVYTYFESSLLFRLKAISGYKIHSFAFVWIRRNVDVFREPDSFISTTSEKFANTLTQTEYN